MRYLGIMVLVFVSLWLLLKPSPIDPARVADTGELADTPLPVEEGHIEGLVGGRLDGAEDVALDDRGLLYTGQADGTIVRIDRWSGTVESSVFAVTGGRPLGLDFDDEGRLWVADSSQGLLSIESDGQVLRRPTHAGGLDVHFANDVAIGPRGRVYFSDSSAKFGPDELALEALEARPHGRLLCFDPTTEETEVRLDDLYFANGVAIARGGDFILIAETFRYRIQRLWLTGPRAGTSEILIDDLPGFPDGISANDHGTFWVAVYRPRSELLDRILHPRPWLKRLVARLPVAMLTDRSRFGMVLEIDGAGAILRAVTDPEGRDFFAVTSVEEHEGELFLASIEMNAIGIVSIAP